jgi:hypothetical protein
MKLAGAALRRRAARLQLAGAAGRLREAAAQLVGARARQAEPAGQPLEVTLAALQELLGVLQALRQLLEVLRPRHQRTRTDDGLDARVTRDLRLEAIERDQQRAACDRAVVAGDDDVVRRRPARAHGGGDRLEVLPRLRRLGQLRDVRRPRLEA